MAEMTKNRAASPPRAPEREATGRLVLRAYAIVVMIAIFAHSAVYNLVGMTGAVILLGAVTITTLAIGIPALAQARPHSFPWRRLPWTALGYVVLAVLSTIWSDWRNATLLTWLLLAAITINALFIAHVLTWKEIARALASTFKWILGLSVALELWVAVVLQKPLLPNFAELPAGPIDPHWYWVRGNLFDGNRIQGIVGNSNLLAILCLLAIVVFAIRLAARSRWRVTLALWIALACYLMYRADSATAYLCAVAAAVVLAIALLIRRAPTPAARTKVYAICTAAVAILLVAGIVLKDTLLGALGRSADLTGRFDIWSKVWERASSAPLVGNGFSSPWVPMDPAFAGWIEDHGITVFHAHQMWLDVFLQLGGIGVLLMAVAYISLLWRSWFFAVDRPRWDLRADRPYSPLSLLPLLMTVILLVHGISESTPIMLWGWLLLVMLSFKLKSVPLIGSGLDERRVERGAPARRVP